jgi:hypothetical protein
VQYFAIIDVGENSSPWYNYRQFVNCDPPTTHGPVINNQLLRPSPDPLRGTLPPTDYHRSNLPRHIDAISDVVKAAVAICCRRT